MFERFMEIAQREKSKLILGQTLSSTPSPTGEIGSGTASLQSDVRDDIRRLDAQMLADTLRDQLFIQLCAINRLPGRAPYIVWGAASTAELRAKADLLGSLRNAGLEIDDPSIEPLSDEIGFGLRRSQAAPSAGPALFGAAREVGADRVFFRREHGRLP
jgi:phage gp29-like protein